MLGICFILFFVFPVFFVYQIFKNWKSGFEEQRMMMDYKRKLEEYEREQELTFQETKRIQERILKEQEAEREREKLQERNDCFRFDMLMAFSSYPWDIWPVEAHNGNAQLKRIIRAFNSDNLEVLSFTPHDYSARVRGDSKEIYSVTPQSCECPDFKKRLLPCKHMYALALALYRGFSDSTFIGEHHNILSSSERDVEQKRKNIEKQIPHKNILKFLQENNLASTQEIVKHFSPLDGKDIRSAISKLYSVGSISRKKEKGKYFYFIPLPDDVHANTCDSFSRITLPTFPEYPVSSHPLRCYTNFGIFEVHGINPKTGKQNKRKIIALDEIDARRAAHVLEKLQEPITVEEIPIPPATERQIDYAIDLGNVITDELSIVDASALISNTESETSIPITKEDWITACESRVCISALLNKSNYDLTMKYYRNYYRFLE